LQVAKNPVLPKPVAATRAAKSKTAGIVLRKFGMATPHVYVCYPCEVETVHHRSNCPLAPRKCPFNSHLVTWTAGADVRSVGGIAEVSDVRWIVNGVEAAIGFGVVGFVTVFLFTFFTGVVAAINSASDKSSTANGNKSDDLYWMTGQ